MGRWDTIKAFINQYRTPTRIPTPTTTPSGTIGGVQVVQSAHSSVRASPNITSRPGTLTTQSSYGRDRPGRDRPGRDRPTDIKKKTQTIEVPIPVHNNIVQTPLSLRATNVHSAVTANPNITARPGTMKRVEPIVFRDPRTYAELKQVLGAMEQKVSPYIPDVASVEAAQVRHVEQYPKTAAVVHQTFGQLPKPVFDYTQAAGKSTYGYVQENPLKTAGWVGVSLFGGEVIGGAAKVATPITKILPYGPQTVRAAELFAKTKYISKIPEAAMVGAFGYIEHKTITQPVTAMTPEGMVYERKPTYAEMGARSGEGIAISGALLFGVGIAKYGGKVKGLLTKAPTTSEEVALAAEEVKYTVLKGFKTTEKQQLRSGIVDFSTTKTRLITEDIPASLIDAGEVARWKKTVQYEDVRPMFSSYTQSVTNPLGETLSLQKTGKIDLIRGAPEPDDIVSGIQQMTLGDMSLSKLGTGPTKLKFGGVPKDVFKRGSRDWAIDLKLDSVADMGKVKGIEQFSTSTIGTGITSEQRLAARHITKTDFISESEQFANIETAFVPVFERMGVKNVGDIPISTASQIDVIKFTGSREYGRATEWSSGTKAVELGLGSPATPHIYAHEIGHVVTKRGMGQGSTLAEISASRFEREAAKQFEDIYGFKYYDPKLKVINQDVSHTIGITASKIKFKPQISSEFKLLDDSIDESVTLFSSKGEMKPIFEIPTTITHTRGKITGTIDEPLSTKPPTTPKHLTINGKQWGTKHVGLDQPKLDEFWSEGGTILKKKTIDAIKGFKIDIPKQTKKLTGKPMKPLYTKKDDSIIARMSDDIKSGSSGQIQIFDAVEDVKAVPKTKGVVAEQILDMIEPKQTGFQAGAMLPKSKYKPPIRMGNAFGAPSALGFSRDLSFGQVVDVTPTVKQTQRVSIAPIFDVAPAQTMTPLVQIKPTVKTVPFVIIGTKFKPVTSFAQAQAQRTKLTPVTSYVPAQAQRIKLTPFNALEPLIKIPKPPKKPPIIKRLPPKPPKKPPIIKVPKPKKKTKGKKKGKKSEKDYWTFTNPIKSAKDML